MLWVFFRPLFYNLRLFESVGSFEVFLATILEEIGRWKRQQVDFSVFKFVHHNFTDNEKVAEK